MKSSIRHAQVRLNPADYRLLTLLAQQLELPQSQVIRKAIRELAKREKLK